MKDLFLEKISLHQSKLQTLKNKSKTIALVRGIVAVLGVLSIVYFANQRETIFLLISIALSLGFFIPLVILHKRIKFQESIHEISINIFQKEFDKLEGKFNQLDGGNEFLERDHPYSSDLDLFGEHSSLFQLINHTVTQKGRALLGHWMKNRLDKSDIIIKQEIVEELSSLVDWRTQFEALSEHFHQKHKGNESNIIDYLKVNHTVPSSIRAIAWLCGALSLAAIAFWLLDYTPITLLFLPILINGVLIYKYHEVITQTTNALAKNSSLLATYNAQFELIVNQEFKHSKLIASKNLLVEGNALPAIQSLNKIAYRFESRTNNFYWILNILFLIDVHNLYSASTWVKNYQFKISEWIDVIANFEANNSIAAFSFANPKFHFPKISDQAYIFESEELGHPLIIAEKRVHNNFNFNKEGQLALITGSNMSGKSTFLRTCGINMVLAFMGAPVCAKSMIISPSRIFTSMRTEDNLEESVSAFYAELRRIQMLLESVENNKEPLIFMLDELLKGTNSEDRHAGAEALIKQLKNTGVSGFISTHDLGLGRLEDDTFIQNYSFTSSLKGNELVFDYKIKDGMCENFNALTLMKQIGIRISN
ncbi:MutS-related protein [Sediminitomix flava]|uniref:MutS-like protein n=1 Tax=Sediminitomix flava TaxID=379075 RepID=A0A315ZB12_SEDFL|nr:hypothetical protein [Sediminitomix flava]PWJ42776.1 MutS-like protein [Sediminitomix flava]